MDSGPFCVSGLKGESVRANKRPGLYAAGSAFYFVFEKGGHGLTFVFQTSPSHSRSLSRTDMDSSRMISLREAWLSPMASRARDS